jgi:hypothetical protein
MVRAVGVLGSVEPAVQFGLVSLFDIRYPSMAYGEQLEVVSKVTR